jgi:hypothetical protein
VLTREASLEEAAYFEHDRAPVSEARLFEDSISPHELPEKDWMLPGFQAAGDQ